LARREDEVDRAEANCRPLLVKMGSIYNLKDLTAQELAAPTGLEPFEVLRAQALIELGRRMVEAGKGEVREFSDPDAVAEYLSDLRDQKREFFVALLLDAKNQLIRRADVHIGTANTSLVGAREVFREAVKDGAVGIIVAHNHPSGDPTPSPEDVAVTRQLRDAGKLLDIPLLDHVIIGESRHVSLRRMGLL
jgi:DNA repair protein RadC